MRWDKVRRPYSQRSANEVDAEREGKRYYIRTQYAGKCKLCGVLIPARTEAVFLPGQGISHRSCP